MTVSVQAGTLFVPFPQRWSSAVTVLFVTPTSPSAGSLTLRRLEILSHRVLTDSRQAFLGKIRIFLKLSKLQIDLFTIIIVHPL